MKEFFQLVFSILNIFSYFCLLALVIACVLYGWRLKVGNFLTLTFPGLMFKSKNYLNKTEGKD